jgi:hypothetical protein
MVFVVVGAVVGWGVSACLVFINSRRTVGFTDMLLVRKVLATLGHWDNFSNTM